MPAPFWCQRPQWHPCYVVPGGTSTGVVPSAASGLWPLASGLWPLASCRVRPLASCKRGVSWLLAIDAKVFLGKGDLGFNAHIGAARERFDEAQARQEPGVIGGLNRHAGAGVEL